jgi:hypothetical protein
MTNPSELSHGVGPTPQEILAHEAEGRTRAAAAAILAGVLTLLGGYLLLRTYSDFPHVYLVEALRDAGGLDIGRAGLKTQQILFYDDESDGLLLGTGVRAVAALAQGVALAYLIDATRARRPEAPRMMRGVVLFGVVAVALSELVLQGVASKLAADFAAQKDHSTQAAHDALKSDVLITAQFLGFLGTFSLALGFVLTGLNAMRAGLLTRFMGVLGIIVGALFVFPVGGSIPVVQSMWLITIGVLFLGRWPNGVPPAWEQGIAIPWPSQQDLREAADAERGAARPTRTEPTTEAPSPATSAKKKRKRRG